MLRMLPKYAENLIRDDNQPNYVGGQKLTKMTKEQVKSMSDISLIRAYGFAKFHKSTTVDIPKMYERHCSHVSMYENELNKRNIPLTAKEQDYE